MTCTLCPLHKEAKSICVGPRPALYGTRTLHQQRKANSRFKGPVLDPADEDTSVEILLVGEAPGDQEDKLGRPFIGPSGAYLDKFLEVLQDNGLDLRTVALSNAVRCRPPDNRNPKMTEKRACRVHLDDEVRALRPRLVIALGAQAWSAMQNKASASIAADRLKVLPYEDLDGNEIEGVRMAVTYHPAAVLRDKTRARPLLEDLTAFLIHGQDRKADNNERPQVWTVNTLRGLEGVMSKLKSARQVALDIETVGFTPNVLTVALSFPPYKRAYVLPVHHPESKLPGRKVMDQLRALLLEREDLLVIGQNVKYDLGRLAWYFGEPVTIRCKADDAMNLHYMLDEHAPTRSLDYYSRRYTETGGYKDEINKANLINEPLHSVARYNGTDAAIVPGICEQFRGELKSFGYDSPQLQEFYRRIVPLVAALEANGMHIDIEALDAAKDIHDKGVAEAEAALRAHCPEDLNLQSPSQLGEYLFGKDGLGLKIPDVPNNRTPTGQPATGKHILDALEGQHPFVDSLSGYRTATKMRSSYVEAIYKHIYPDRCVHPSYFIIKTAFGQDEGDGGTVSGRFSAKKPAVQTIPKKDPVRAAYASRYPGGFILNLDGAQMELRYGGWVAGDRNIEAACAGDPHQGTADLVGTTRDIGKRVNFACVHADTPVLRDDFSWTRAGDLAAGDGLMAFDEHQDYSRGTHGRQVARRWRRGHVIQNNVVLRECLRIVLDNGDRLICTPEHPLIVRENQRAKSVWVEARNLRVGQSVPKYTGTPWVGRLNLYDVGWMAGFLDGEGWVTKTGSSSGFAQVDGPVFDRAVEIATEWGFNCSFSRKEAGGRRKQAMNWCHIRGGFSEQLRFLGTFGPARLVSNLRDNAHGTKLFGALPNDPKIVSVVNCGMQPIAAMETSTRTYVSAGYASHNSIYGVSVDGLVEKAGVPPAVARKVAPRLKRSWAKLYAYLDAVGQDAVTHKEVCTPYGAYRRVPDANHRTGQGRHLVRSALNYVIQRAASDVVQLLGWRLMLELDGLAVPITSTHDSTTWDVPAEHFDRVVEIMGNTVQHVWKQDVYEVLGLEFGEFPFAFDLTAGPNWLEQSDVASFKC